MFLDPTLNTILKDEGAAIVLKSDDVLYSVPLSSDRSEGSDPTSWFSFHTSHSSLQQTAKPQPQQAHKNTSPIQLSEFLP